MENLTSRHQQTILAVDDTRENLEILHEMLKSKYNVKMADSGLAAMQSLEKEPHPDLILLDVIMSDMDGYTVCKTLKSNPKYKDIPIIFLTAQNDVRDEMMGFQLGAEDYIAKPISPPILFARVHTHLQMHMAQKCLRDNNVLLEAEVAQRTKDLIALQDAMLLSMASLAETRDNETGGHLLRTQQYVKRLASQLRKHKKYSEFLDDEKTLDILFKCAPLHDIGKVGIPDRILLKPGALTPDEFEIMQTHPLLGRETIMATERRLGFSLPFLSIAKQISYSHHERWDGTGYPEGLQQDSIPIAGRLMAIVDVYDALTSNRVYKAPIPHKDATEMIVKGSGIHFDPEMVNAFEFIADDFQKIALQIQDYGASQGSRSAVFD